METNDLLDQIVEGFLVDLHELLAAFERGELRLPPEEDPMR
jgi:hypothetical protein